MLHLDSSHRPRSYRVVHGSRLVLHQQARRDARHGERHDDHVGLLKALLSEAGGDAAAIASVVVDDVLLVDALGDHLGEDEGPGRRGEPVVEHVVGADVGGPEDLPDAQDHERPDHPEGDAAERDADDERPTVRDDGQDRVREDRREARHQEEEGTGDPPPVDAAASGLGREGRLGRRSGDDPAPGLRHGEHGQRRGRDGLGEPEGLDHLTEVVRLDGSGAAEDGRHPQHHPGRRGSEHLEEVLVPRRRWWWWSSSSRSSARIVFVVVASFFLVVRRVFFVRRFGSLSRRHRFERDVADVGTVVFAAAFGFVVAGFAEERHLLVIITARRGTNRRR
mmetsp:Transcript_2404/g.6466  ORF Transcript_2404/g.6466 Transcript_2404/m.6466 type:complete len:336 (+) Transcript_2404:79-1086(+)